MNEPPAAHQTKKESLTQTPVSKTYVLRSVSNSLSASKKSTAKPGTTPAASHLDLNNSFMIKNIFKDMNSSNEFLTATEKTQIFESSLTIYKHLKVVNSLITITTTTIIINTDLIYLKWKRTRITIGFRSKQIATTIIIIITRMLIRAAK